MQIEQAAIIGMLSALGPIILGLWQAWRGSKDRSLDRDATAVEKAYQRADENTKMVIDFLKTLHADALKRLEEAEKEKEELEREVDEMRDIARAWYSLAHDTRSAALGNRPLPDLPPFDAAKHRTKPPAA